MFYRELQILGLCAALMLTSSLSQADSKKTHVFTKLEICELAGYFDAEKQQFLNSLAFRLSGITDTKSSKDDRRHCGLLMESGKSIQRNMMSRFNDKKPPTDNQIKLAQKANLFKHLVQDAILQQVDFEIIE